MDKYVAVKQIGRGSFGKCMLVQRKPDKKLFVLKEVNVQEMTPSERKEAMNEVNVLSVLRHNNIIAYHESFVSEGVLNIVMEYAEGGDLHQAIQKRQGDKSRAFFSETEIMEWFCQISLALQYTHKKNILHRDLKTQNIFLTSSKIIKLGDFGIAKVLNSDTEFAKTIIGTPYYLSPEMCEDQPYDSKSDIWALGCVLYEMATLRHAFDAHNLPALVLKILKGDYPPIPQVYSKDLSNLVKSMLRTDPKERPSISEILATALVQKYLPGVVKQLSAAVPRRSVPVPRKPLPAGESSAAKKSPEKLQILKLRNEPKAKSKENLKKVGNSPGSTSPRGVSPVPKPTRVAAKSSTKSPASGTSRLNSSNSSSPRANLASPRTPASASSPASSSASPASASPRSRTPPPLDGTPPLTPRSQQNSPRPYSSPAISHRSTSNSNKDSKPDTLHVPTPRPVAVTPVQEKKVYTHQRAKSEPLKRSRPSILSPTSSSSKPSSSTSSSTTPSTSTPSAPSSIPSAPPKPSPIVIAKKRTPIKLELKQHEQKFKDNLKSVKARIAGKPFQNATKQEPLSPTSAASSQLLFIIPPSSPTSPTPPPNGTVSAPVTPRAGASTQQHPKRAITSARTPSSSPASASTRASPASASARSPAHANSASLRATTSAAAIKAAASSQAHASKQKSLTAKTESLKEVIKKNREQIKKDKGERGEVSVEIVVPKHMEHLLNMESTAELAQENPDSETEEAKEESVEKEEKGNGAGEDELVIEEIEDEIGEKREEKAKEKEGGGEKEEEKEKEEAKEKERESEKEKEKEKDKEKEKEGNGNEEDRKLDDSQKFTGNVRFSTDLSKMDKLSIRIETLRQKCEQVFGEDTFFKVYKYLREMKQDADDKEIQNTLHKMVGNEKLAYMRYVDQLIFCELQFYGS